MQFTMTMEVKVQNRNYDCSLLDRGVVGWYCLGQERFPVMVCRAPLSVQFVSSSSESESWLQLHLGTVFPLVKLASVGLRGTVPVQ